MIYLHNVFMDTELQDEYLSALFSKQLSYGKHTKKFENLCSNFINNDYFLSISGNSIQFALKLLDIGEGDEVIASPGACLVSTQPIVNVGAKVVWCDIDPQRGTIDPDVLKQKITSKTKAILHYHWSGYPGYVNEVNFIAKSNNIFVIEDAIESFGSIYDGRIIGSNTADITCFSFTAARIPNTIDGAGLSFTNKELYEKAMLMRDLGINRSIFRESDGEISDKMDVSLRGEALLLNNFSGFIGSRQMKHIDNLLKKQRTNAKKYNAFFQDYNGVALLSVEKKAIPNYWTYTLLSNNRPKLMDFMRSQNIQVSKLHFRNDLYTVFNKEISTLKGVDKFMSTQFSIPCGWWMNSEDVIRCMK